MQKERLYRLIIMSAGGVHLDVDQILAVPDATVVSCEVVNYERSGCASLLVKTLDVPETLHRKSRRWASARGWTVTVASQGGGD
jgi:hypothetical protein